MHMERSRAHKTHPDQTRFFGYVPTPPWVRSRIRAPREGRVVTRARTCSSGLLTSASVEYTHSTLSAIVNLVSEKHRIALGFDPHPGHGVVKDFVLFE